MDTITSILNRIDAEAKTLKIDLSEAGLYDDEDIVCFALNYLLANMDNAFEGLGE